MIPAATVILDRALAAASPIIPAPLSPHPPRWVDDLLRGAAPAVQAPGGVTVSTAGRFAQFSTAIGGASRLGAEALRARVARAYIAIAEAVAARRYHPIRFWNFVPRPNAEMAPGLDRYMVFNAGRYDAYACWHGTPRAFSQALATASAVGVESADLVICCLTSRAPGTAVENPRQTPSWQYSARYGPKPPCFARATIVTHGRDRQLLIGGTASIVGEESRHVGDAAGQVEETIANLAALISTARAGRRPQGPDRIGTNLPADATDISRLTDVRVYVAGAQDAALVHALVVARCPGVTRLEMSLSQICRPELLVEIEGVARI
jgi:chorismate lyase/3-hydroxybenzoate synthase